MPATIKLDKSPDYLADVDVTGGYPELEAEPTRLTNAVVSVNGRTVVLAQMDRQSRRHRQFDRIVDAQIEDGGKGKYIFSGMSERLAVEPYSFKGEDAMVRWVATLKKCATC